MADENKIDDQLLQELFRESSTDLRQLVKNEVYEVCLVEDKENELVPIALECLPLDVPLSCPLYVKVAGKFVMFRRQGDTLTNRRIVQFHQKRVEIVFIHKTFWDHFLKIIEDLQLPEPITPELKVKHIRRVMIIYGEEIEKHAKRPKKEIFDKLMKQSFQLADEISLNPRVGMKSVHRNLESTAYFFNHAVNSAVFSALIGKTMGYNLNDLRILTYAGLVHDVGNVFIPKAILLKVGALSQSERDEVETHTSQGAELLQMVGSPPAVVTVALQHHERMNGAGYPRKLKGEQIHPYAKIVAIADVFDAIISNRPHKVGRGVEEALKEMKSQEGLFDPKFLSKVFRNL